MNDLLNGTLADAVEILAAVWAEKRAAGVLDDLSGYASDAYGAVKENPTLSHGLIGAGVGAGLGGLSTAYQNQSEDPADRRSVWRSALTGGAVGGATGAGIGLARTGLAGLSPAAPGAGDKPPAFRPVQYTDPTTGQVKQVTNLMSPDEKAAIEPSTGRQIGTALGRGINTWNENLPASLRINTGLLAADVAMHNPLANLTTTDPSQVGGAVGRKALIEGLSKMPDADMPKATRDALMAGPLHGKTPVLHPDQSGVTAESGPQYVDPLTVTSTVPARPVSLADRFRQQFGQPMRNPPTLKDTLGGYAGVGSGGREVATIQAPEFKTTTTDEFPHEKLNAEGKKVPDLSRKVEVPGIRYEGLGPKMPITEAHIGQGKTLGIKEHPDLAGRTIHTLPGTNRSYTGSKNLGQAAGKRLLAYGTAPVLEYLYNQLSGGPRTEAEVRDIVGQHTKDVPEAK